MRGETCLGVDPATSGVFRVVANSLAMRRRAPACPSEDNEGSGASEQRDDSTTEPCQQTRTNIAADRPPDAKEPPRANFILRDWRRIPDWALSRLPRAAETATGRLSPDIASRLGQTAIGDLRGPRTRALISCTTGRSLSRR